MPRSGRRRDRAALKLVDAVVGNGHQPGGRREIAMQLGPDTAMPAASMARLSSAPSARPFGSPPSPKPPENTVALRAPALPAATIESIALRPAR